MLLAVHVTLRNGIRVHPSPGVAHGVFSTRKNVLVSILLWVLPRVAHGVS